MRLESHDNYLCGLFSSSTSHTSRIQTVLYHDSLGYFFTEAHEHLTDSSDADAAQPIGRDGRSGLQVQFA